jgi:phage/plasmid-associated DNA primase
MPDRLEYLKAIFYSILLGKTELQVFFYFYGFVESGKSTVG